MNRHTVPDADVIVTGAGLTGGVLALLLRQAGFSLILIEARDKSAVDTHTPDPRALAVTPASRRLLELTGVWQALPPERIGTFHRMEVWEDSAIRFDCADLGEPALGYIVEASLLQQALENTLAADSGITWCRPATPAGLTCEADAARMVLDDGRSIQARLIVAADGRDSRSRDLAGISYLETPYPQQALACVVETERPHEAVARQRFLSDGPLAFLPMAGPNQSGIVWSTSPEHAGELLMMPDALFAETLAAAFEYRLGAVLEIGQRATFSLLKAEAIRYCQSRFVMVGDAAHSVHPLAGQGANMGWLDVACLAEVLIDARTEGRDTGSLRVLRRYERWRRGENRIMQLGLDGLHHLFRRQDPATVFIRNLGLGLTDHSGPLKHHLMSYAMGRAGDLPRLLRRGG